MPPPSPVTTLKAIRVPRLGAKADAKTPMESNESPVNATGRLPKESDTDPTATTETAQAAYVAVASCPVTATEVSNSVAIATNSGANINDALWATNIPTATAARKRFTSYRPLAKEVGCWSEIRGGTETEGIALA